MSRTSILLADLFRSSDNSDNYKQVESQYRLGMRVHTTHSELLSSYRGLTLDIKGSLRSLIRVTFIVHFLQKLAKEVKRACHWGLTHHTQLNTCPATKKAYTCPQLAKEVKRACHWVPLGKSLVSPITHKSNLNTCSNLATLASYLGTSRLST